MPRPNTETAEAAERIPLGESAIVATSMSLDDLVVLNDEMASLVRAGVPLELGLSSWRRDVSGPLRRAAARLEAAVAAGQSLDDALADPALGIPPVYRAVVTAGLRSGRLAAALESLADNARNLRSLQHAIGLAFVYPLLVVTIAYGMFVLVTNVVLPGFVMTYEGDAPRYLSALTPSSVAFHRGTPLPGELWLLPPLVLWLIAGIWWYQTRRAMVLDAGWASRLLCWVPLAGRATRRARSASLAEIFALLVDYGVPLADAMRLAAGCTRDRRAARTGNDVAAAIERGERPARDQLETLGLPPVVALLMTTGANQQTLVALARQAAENDQARAMRDVQLLRDWLPVGLILVVGLTVGLFCCLLVFLPLTDLMEALARPLHESLRIRP